MPPNVKQLIKEAITKVVPDSIEVKDDGCPGGFNGNSPENIVNRLSAKGLQIEQSEEARKFYGIDISDTVADVIGPLIKVSA